MRILILLIKSLITDRIGRHEESRTCYQLHVVITITKVKEKITTKINVLVSDKTRVCFHIHKKTNLFKSNCLSKARVNDVYRPITTKA